LSVRGGTARAILAGVGLATWLGGCKPDIGNPPSLVTGPRLLGMRQVPPEVRPGAAVTFEALVADVDGTVPASIAWTLCKTPRPPAESNSVSQVCVTQPDDDAAMVGPVMVPMPPDACSLFGPDPPPVTPPIRPRDPDPTGGFYVPVRASAVTADGSTLLGFAFERIQCNLAGAPGDLVRTYNMTYIPNVAPRVADVVLDPEGVAPASLVSSVLAGGATPAATVSASARVVLRLSWPAESAESYVRYDRSSRTLVMPREALSVSWFATDGEFEHDRTGRSGDEPEAFTDDVWTAPTAAAGAVVHFWVVLRDERGGVDEASFDLTIGP
jgi:hypothetical protein